VRRSLKFIRGVLRMPIGWQLWLALLVAGNLIVPLFFFARPEARVVLAAFLFAGMLMMILAIIAGFTRILGLGHFVWFLLLPYLWTRLDQIPVDDFFGVWVRALMVLNATSLVIDVIDVIRYIAGDREETVEGL
jgi:hypothetical protein